MQSRYGVLSRCVRRPLLGLHADSDTTKQLRHLLQELEDYEPPLDLVALLTPTAPLRVRDMQQDDGDRSWWKGKGRARNVGDRERERALVRVLSGEEELATLPTPKVTFNHACSSFDGQADI